MTNRTWLTILESAVNRQAPWSAPERRISVYHWSRNWFTLMTDLEISNCCDPLFVIYSDASWQLLRD